MMMSIIIKMSLVVVMLAATVQAGVLPHLMFAAAGRPGQQQQQSWPIHRPQQQQPQKQQQGDAYANYFERAAALMAASGADLDLSAAGVQQPVYGIPHRYLSDPYPLPATQMGQQQINRPDLLTAYSGNPLYSSGMSSLYKNNKRSVSASGSGYSNYDLMAAMLSADLAAEEQQQQAAAAAAAADYLEDEPMINQQDALNFENYVQRFFQQQQQQQQQLYDNDWSDEAIADAFDDDSQFDWQVPQEQPQQQLMDNDEEAAQQLHLLLQQVEQQQRSRPSLPMNIQKKSVPVPVTTVAPVPVATPMTVSATQQGGQKEEAMLRPPAPAKQSSTTTTSTTTTTSAPQPTYGTKKSSVPKNEDSTKSGKSIYRTIHRLMADSSENKEEGSSDRAKRFVPYNPESIMLSKQIHALDKIKAK